MRFTNFAYIVSGNLTERKGRTILAVVIVAFAVSVTLSVIALTGGFLKGVIDRAQTLFPPSILMVKPKTTSVMMFAFNSGVLDQAAVDKIRKFPGVGKVDPQLSLKMPLRMEVTVAGQTAVTDAVVVGVSPDSMISDVNPRFTFAYDPQSSVPMPAIVPRFLLDMYNLAYADSIGLPKISEQALIGKHFTLALGGSYLMGKGGTDTAEISCQVVGLSNNSNLVAGVYVPLDQARELNRVFGGQKTDQYSALQVTVPDLQNIETVTQGLDKMNLMVDDGKRNVFEAIHFAIKAVTILLFLFAIIIAIVSTVSIANMFAMVLIHRRDEMTLMRVVGARKGTVRWLYLTESAIIGFIGSLVALAIVIPLAYYGNVIILRRLPHLSFMPDSIFLFNPWQVCVCLIVAIGICLLVTLSLVSRIRENQSM